MGPQTILKELWEAGFCIALSADASGLAVSPSSRLTAHERQLLVAHKAELVSYILDIEEWAPLLLELADQVCDQFEDGPSAREQMKFECLQTPYHLRQDLLEHFEQRVPRRRMESRQREAIV